MLFSYPQLLGVTATCALELGVDIGELDVTLHLGFPGGRRGLVAVVVAVVVVGAVVVFMMMLLFLLFSCVLDVMTEIVRASRTISNWARSYR